MFYIKYSLGRKILNSKGNGWTDNAILSFSSPVPKSLSKFDEEYVDFNLLKLEPTGRILESVVQDNKSEFLFEKNDIQFFSPDKLLLFDNNLTINYYYAKYFLDYYDNVQFEEDLKKKFVIVKKKNDIVGVIAIYVPDNRIS